MNQEFELTRVPLAPEEDALGGVQHLVDQGIQFVDLNVPADPAGHRGCRQAADVLLFNAGAPDDRLREQDCRDNVLHILPSRAMLADALRSTW